MFVPYPEELNWHSTFVRPEEIHGRAFVCTAWKRRCDSSCTFRAWMQVGNRKRKQRMHFLSALNVPPPAVWLPKIMHTCESLYQNIFGLWFKFPRRLAAVSGCMMWFLVLRTALEGEEVSSAVIMHVNFNALSCSTWRAGSLNIWVRGSAK